MKELILMRHAKTEVAAAGMADFDRALTDRGEADATRIGDWIADRDWIPDLILCSAAKRTSQTAEQLLAGWDAVPQVLYDRRLYLANPEGIREVLQGDHLGCDRVMVIGHNPGIAILADTLADGTLDAFPTAATVLFSIDTTRWEEPWRRIQLIDRVTAKSLRDGDGTEDARLR